MEGVVRAVKLFIEYVSVNLEAERDYRIFMMFAQRLQTGTFDKTGFDPSGLGWSGIGIKRSQKVVNHLKNFFNHLEAKNGIAPLHFEYGGDSYDRKIEELAYQYRRDRAFLGHTWAETSQNSAQSKNQHFPKTARQLKKEHSEPPAFPDDLFVRLITDGFKVGGEDDYRNILITLLLHGAGFRVSEPFHLYVSDVMPDPENPKSALVFIHHPSEGAAPSDWYDEQDNTKKGNRANYLREKWGREPRDIIKGGEHAGWKGGALEHKYNSYFYRAYWFEPEYGELFLMYWYKYLQQLALLERKHPYAFVNLERGDIGAPYKLGQYIKAHEKAVERIGATVSKSEGTTTHGHRHSYGRRLAKAGVSKSNIRRFMHHASEVSQETYTGPTLAESLTALKEAESRLSQHDDYVNAAKSVLLVTT